MQYQQGDTQPIFQDLKNLLGAGHGVRNRGWQLERYVGEECISHDCEVAPVHLHAR